MIFINKGRLFYDEIEAPQIHIKSDFLTPVKPPSPCISRETRHFLSFDRTKKLKLALGSAHHLYHQADEPKEQNTSTNFSLKRLSEPEATRNSEKNFKGKSHTHVTGNSNQSQESFPRNMLHKDSIRSQSAASGFPQQGK